MWTGGVRTKLWSQTGLHAGPEGGGGGGPHLLTGTETGRYGDQQSAQTGMADRGEAQMQRVFKLNKASGKMQPSYVAHC